MEELAPAPFGVLLRRYRSKPGLALAELAERAGISPEAISTLQRGFRRNLHRDAVRLLCRREAWLMPIELHQVHRSVPAHYRGDGIFVHNLHGRARNTWQVRDRPNLFCPRWLGEEEGDAT